MKRIEFLKTLLGLPFVGYSIARKLQPGHNKQRCLINKLYVAGFQYYKGPAVINEIKKGEELQLKASPKNVYDKFAVEMWHKHVLIGHIPRTDNKHISRLLQQGVNLYCKVAEVNPERKTWKMLKAEIYL